MKRSSYASMLNICEAKRLERPLLEAAEGF